MERKELKNLQNAGKYQLWYLQSHSSNWMEFLSKSCNHYSRSFLEQLLITANFPKATAVMEQSLWQRNHFEVKSGENGIVVFKNFDGDFYDNQKVNAATTKTYYDISQVKKVSAKSQNIYRWKASDIDESIIIESIYDNHKNVDTTTLAHAVITALSSEVSITNVNLKNFIVNSATYQVLTRCDYDANAIFKSEDFALVTRFSSNRSFIRAATESNELASNMLKHIAQIVRKHYNKNKVSVKEEQTYEHNIQSTRRLEKWGTNDNLHQVSQGRNEWSVNSDSGRNGRGTDGTGNIRSQTSAIPQGRTSSEIHRVDVARELNGVSAQNRDGRTETQGNNNRATEESSRSDRGTERERPNEVGRLDEQHNGFSRGDSSSRDSVRINSQVNNANEKAEVDVENQTSAFSIPQQVIDDTICIGSGFANGKFRIYEQFERNLTSQENADFLKNEYGVGGSSPAGLNDGYQSWHDAKGLSITKGYGDNAPNVSFNWKQVASRIYQLIRMDRYLNPKEKEKYPKWLEEQEMKRAELLQKQQEKKDKKENPAEKENVDVEYIYQYAVGDKAYIGSTEYEITSISKGVITLQDVNFPLMDREMRYADFEDILKESIFNDHLKKPKSTYNRGLFISYLAKKLIDNQTVKNAHKNSDFENYKLETNTAIDKIAIDLLVEEETFDNLTLDEVISVVSEFQNIINVKEFVYDSVSEVVDIALTQMETHNADKFSDLSLEDLSQEDSFVRNNDVEEFDEEQNSTAIADNTSEGTFEIYQMKEDEKYHFLRFENYKEFERQNVTPNIADYNLVYSGNLADIPYEDKLEGIYIIFNTNHPDGYTGRSVSVSDVIVTTIDNNKTANFVDRVGYKDVTNLFVEKTNLISEYFSKDNNLGDFLCHQFSSDEIIDVAYALGISNNSWFKDQHPKDTHENIAKRELLAHQFAMRIEDENINTYIQISLNDTGIVFNSTEATYRGQQYSCSWREVGESLYSAVLEYTLDDMYAEIIAYAHDSKAPIIEVGTEDTTQKTNAYPIYDVRQVDISNLYVTYDKQQEKYNLIGDVKQGLTVINESVLYTTSSAKEIVDYLKNHKYVLKGFGLNTDVLLDIEPTQEPKQTDNNSNVLEENNAEKTTSKSVDELEVGDTIRLDGKEWTISMINEDFSVVLKNTDKNSLLSEQSFLGNWKEKISEIGFEYIEPTQPMIEEPTLIEDMKLDEVNQSEDITSFSYNNKVENTIQQISDDIKSLAELFDGNYQRLYEGEINVSNTEKEIYSKAYEDFISKNKDVLSQFVSYREDLISSDREVFAFVLALSESGMINLADYQETKEETATQSASKSTKNNYIITDDNLGVGNKPERFQNNINAIQLLKRLEAENRLASPEEQEILSKYVGWGGLDKYFEPTNSRYSELRACLSDDELKSAQGSTLTAFYTPPVVIRAVYKVLENLGFKNGNILEPSCGIGNFMGMLPKTMSSSKMMGIELDSISGRIAKQLYQKNRISIGGYESENLPDSFFDVAIGNVPFGQIQLSDSRYNKHKFLIHDYFFAKTLDKVCPGGVIAFITSKGTLDKKNNKVRKYLAERATLLGAIRLPNNTFKGAAGTEVTSDIIFLQKKEALSLDNPDWIYLKENADGIVMNQYFVDNPDMIMGDIQLVSGPHGPEMACVSNDNGTLEEKLSNAVAKIQGTIITQNKAFDVDKAIENSETIVIPADFSVKNYSYTMVDGDIFFRKNSIMEKQNVLGLPAERIRGLIKVRDILKDLIDYQTNDYPDDYIVAKRTELNDEYKKFTNKYGLINNLGNKKVFREDSSFPLLTSLEVIDEDGNLKRNSDIFYKRTIKPYIPITHTESSAEALAVSLNECGRVDIPYMAKLTGFKHEKVISDLKNIIYPIPNSDTYQTADEYLSGNVREKLFVARMVAESDSKYANNVTALEKIQPKDLSAAEVKIRLGATWVDTKYIKQFIKEVFQPGYISYSINVNYSIHTGKWNITNKSADKGILARNTYGTKDYNAYQLLELALNLKSPKVYETKVIDGKETRIFKPRETTLARKKQEKIQEKFEEWIFSNPQRRNELLRVYNDMYNSIRNRTYDGSHLKFPGMNPEITLRPHQVNAVARTLYGANTLLAHVVGAGKTFEMIASAMEAKRIGLCNKSLFVVPNHLTEQMGADFLTLYPSANILVATKNDFTPHRRKEFCSRIATGDYDAVIIGHSQFEKIPVSVERQAEFIQEQIDEIIQAKIEAKEQQGERFTIKQLEREEKNLREKLKKLFNGDKKDNVVTFEQLGVDRLFVDEAHKFKNLFIRTKMVNVAGITSSSADKSADLWMKCRYIDEITGGRGLVFATGTPVSNSMSELYTMQRYLQYSELKKLGFEHFDSWAANFGSTVTASELAPEGKKYREKTRFAKFFNLPELMSIFRECADIQTADMLNLPVPKADFKTVVAKPSKEQRAFVDECGNRADRVRSGSVDPTVDNMLKITTDGRKLAVDQRIVNDELPDFEGSKINMCVGNVFNIWKDTSATRSTQLVFCDLSTPSQSFNVYDDIKTKLIDKGVPEKEIAFIHNYNTDSQKAALFSDVRQGIIRVLLGSTEKMGAGTNIQDKLIALHDVDCPWRPSDLEQRLGRILRQGNENENVSIFRYVTEDTFDAYSYQLIENKQKFISQIMSSKTPVREAEDIDQSALSYAEIKMLATGNPLIKEKMDLDIKHTNLKVLRADYLNTKYNLEDMILNSPKKIAEQQHFINRLSLDIDIVNKHPVKDDEFSIILNGSTYTDKKTAGMYLIKLLDKLPHQVNVNSIVIGEYRGFSLSIGRSNNLPSALLKCHATYSVELSDDIYGNFTRINNRLNAITTRKENAIAKLEDYKHQIENVKVEVQKPFEQEQELEDVSNRLEEVNRMLTDTQGNSEYRTIAKEELELLKNTDIELDFVPDRSGNSDFIIKFSKVQADKVDTILNTNNLATLKL